MPRKPTGTGNSLYIPKELQPAVLAAREKYKKYGLADVEIVTKADAVAMLKKLLNAAVKQVAQLETNEKKNG